MMHNDSIHRDNAGLLPLIQDGFPIGERPFLTLAQRLASGEDEIIDHLRELAASGVIRAFGPVFNPRRLGYSGTLVAVRCDADAVDRIAGLLEQATEVTHNYLRGHSWNVWFTILTRSNDRIAEIIDTVANVAGVIAIMDLPVKAVYKIRAVFGGTDKPPSRQNDMIAPPFDMQHRPLVRAYQRGVSFEKRPFDTIAMIADMDVAEVLSLTETWLNIGIIRRFGARLNHRRAGFSVNTLAVWDVPDPDTAGRAFAGIPEASHCYRRKTHPGWPYELFTMLHARTSDDMDALIERMSVIVDGVRPLLLPTLRQLKKTSMRYFEEDER